jgi:hypothetical protein
MSGIKIKSLENGFLVSSGSCTRRTFPTLAEALCSVLDSLDSFGGYTQVSYSIAVTSKKENRTPESIKHERNLVAMIDRIDNGYLMEVYHEPRIEGVSVRNYGFNESGDLIKQVFNTFYSGKSFWFHLSAVKKISESVTCPGGPKITERVVVVIEEETSQESGVVRLTTER